MTGDCSGSRSLAKTMLVGRVVLGVEILWIHYETDYRA